MKDMESITKEQLKDILCHIEEATEHGVENALNELSLCEIIETLVFMNNHNYNRSEHYKKECKSWKAQYEEVCNDYY